MSSKCLLDCRKSRVTSRWVLLHWVTWSGFYYTAHFLLLYSFPSHVCPCLYYICTVQKVHINYHVRNKSKNGHKRHPFLCVFVSCLCVFFPFLFRWHRRRSTHHRHKKGKKYLDLFVWDSTIAMSEGRRRKRRVETAMFVTTGARNSPPHLLLKVSAIFFFQPIRLWNISLANLSRARERLSSWIASFFFFFKSYKNTSDVFSSCKNLKGKVRGNRIGTFELQKDREGEGAVDTAVVIQVKLPATCWEKHSYNMWDRSSFKCLVFFCCFCTPQTRGIQHKCNTSCMRIWTIPRRRKRCTEDDADIQHLWLN